MGEHRIPAVAEAVFSIQNDPERWLFAMLEAVRLNTKVGSHMENLLHDLGLLEWYDPDSGETIFPPLQSSPCRLTETGLAYLKHRQYAP